jgi:hypothetical protein
MFILIIIIFYLMYASYAASPRGTREEIHGNDPMLPVGGAAMLCQNSPGPKLPAKACK